MESATHEGIMKSATPISFMDLPGELRNQIYHEYFATALRAHGPESNANCRRVESLRPALALLSTSNIIRHEASPIFWIDHVQKFYWSLGLRPGDNDRLVSFSNAARKYTISVNMTFHQRHNTAIKFSAKTVWLILESTFDLPREAKALQELRDDWEARHRDPNGFVWMKHVNFREGQKAVTLQYKHWPGWCSWMLFRGHLAMIDWGTTFAKAEADVEASRRLCELCGDEYGVESRCWVCYSAAEAAT